MIRVFDITTSSQCLPKQTRLISVGKDFASTEVYSHHLFRLDKAKNNKTADRFVNIQTTLKQKTETLKNVF